MQTISTKYLFNAIFRTTGMSFLFYLCNYMVSMVLTHQLTPADFGNYTVAVAWALIWTKVISLGASSTVPRFFVKYAQEKNLNKGSGLIIFFSITSLIAGLLIAVATLYLWYFHLIELHHNKSDLYHPMLIALFMLPLMGFSKIAASLISSRKKFIWASIPEGLFLPTVFIVLFFLGKSFANNINADYAITTMFVSFISIFLIWLWVLPKVGRIKLAYKSAEFEVKHWCTIGIPIMLQGMFSALQFQIALIMIEILDSSEHIVGAFSVVFVLVQLYNYVDSTLTKIFAPLISTQLNNKADKATIISLHRRQRNFSLLLALIIAIVFSLLAKPLLLLFGNFYLKAYWAFIIIVIGKSFTMIGLSALNHLQLYKKGHLINITYLLVITLSIILNLFLIPQYSITGAAIAMSLSIMLNFFLRAFLAKRYLGLPIF